MIEEGVRRRGVERIVEQEEADVIKRVVSETRPGGNGYPYSYNLLRFQGVDRSSCLRNTRCILIIRTSMTVRALNYRAATIFKSLSLSSFVFFTPFATREGKNCWNGGRVYSTLSSSFFVIIIIISRARMFTRRFEFLSKSKRRNVCYQYHNTFEIYLGYFPPRVAFIYVKYCTILPANFNK